MAPRSPADARRRAGTPPPAPAPRDPAAPRPMDLAHVLSAVVGAMVGLVFYSVVTPYHLPDASREVLSDPRAALMDLQMRDLAGSRDAEGFFHVTGKLYNTRPQACKRASVVVVFQDAQGAELSKTLATVEALAARESRAFDVKAYAPKARSFSATVDLAQF